MLPDSLIIICVSEISYIYCISMVEMIDNGDATIHFFPVLHSIIFLFWEIDISQGGSLYSTEISKWYKSELDFVVAVSFFLRSVFLF